MRNPTSMAFHTFNNASNRIVYQALPFTIFTSIVI